MHPPGAEDQGRDTGGQRIGARGRQTSRTRARRFEVIIREDFKQNAAIGCFRAISLGQLAILVRGAIGMFDLG